MEEKTQSLVDLVEKTNIPIVQQLEIIKALMHFENCEGW